MRFFRRADKFSQDLSSIFFDRFLKNILRNFVAKMTEYDEEAFLGEIPKTVLFLVREIRKYAFYNIFNLKFFLFQIICIATSVGALSFCSRAVTAAFLFFFSFIVGRAAIGCFDAETIEHAFKSYTWISKGPEELLFALLPTLVFETAYGFEIQDFRRYKWQVRQFFLFWRRP